MASFQTFSSSQASKSGRDFFITKLPVANESLFPDTVTYLSRITATSIKWWNAGPFVTSTQISLLHILAMPLLWTITRIHHRAFGTYTRSQFPFLGSTRSMIHFVQKRVRSWKNSRNSIGHSFSYFRFTNKGSREWALKFCHDCDWPWWPLGIFRGKFSV